VGVSLYYVSVCLRARLLTGWCRSDIGMDDKRSLSVMNVAIDGKLTRQRWGNSSKEPSRNRRGDIEESRRVRVDCRHSF
jgi:hypothetical protein